MRASVLLRKYLLLAAVAGPALAGLSLQAQFQTPTSEELKMTADPKAPGAAAVYLNVEEIDNNQLHVQNSYVRIKVLAEEGKRLARVELPYEMGDFKINEIKARTIHADGTVIPLKDKPEDGPIVRTGGKQVALKIFTLPDVEVGSILEYRYSLRYDDPKGASNWESDSGIVAETKISGIEYLSPSWEIQRPYFIHKAHYVFTPMAAFQTGVRSQSSPTQLDAHGNLIKSLTWWAVLPSGIQVKSDALGNYSVDATDIPPAPQETWLPPPTSFLYSVKFYYKSVVTPHDFWNDEAALWSRNVNRHAEPSSLIKQVVSGLVAPGDSGMAKAEKLYKAVQSLTNTDFLPTNANAKLPSAKGLQRAEDTWSLKSGTSEEIALLYLAMARAAGLNANATRVVNREQGIFNSTYLNGSQFADTLVLLSIDGKEVEVDPGEMLCPIQSKHWRHAGTMGIRQSADGHNFSSSPFQSYSENTTTRSADLTIDEHGAIEGTLRMAMSGQEALRWRQTSLRAGAAEVKMQFDHLLKSMIPEGVEAHIDQFQGMNDPDVYLVANIKINGKLEGVSATRMTFPLAFLEGHEQQSILDHASRSLPVDMHYAEQDTDELVLHLPAGFALQAVPQDVNIPWEGHAILQIKTTTEPGQVSVTRTLTRGFTLLKPEEYSNLRGFYQKLAVADAHQLVLTRVSTATGN